MDDDERIYTIAEDMFQTIPVLYRWLLRPDATGISPYSPMTSVLRVVKKQGPISMSAIAQALYYSKQNLTNIVDQLVDEGYVERMPDPNDRRVLNIALTEKGRTFMEERKARIRARLMQDLSHLTEEELAHLAETFEEVKQSLPRLVRNESTDQPARPDPRPKPKKQEKV